jgi:lipopolysaccharide export system permease protein
MLIGVVIGMSFNIIDNIVSHLGLIYELSPPLVAFTPSLIVLTVAIYAIKQVH